MKKSSLAVALDWAGAALPWLVLAYLLALAYARFAVAPYYGFYFNTSSGAVVDIYFDK